MKSIILVPFFVLILSGFIFSASISTCSLINTPGTYTLSQSLSGNPLFQYANAPGYACVLVNSTSNVVLDCQGKTILYNISYAGPLTWSTGIAVQNSTNVVVKNCIIASGYWAGIELDNSNYTNVTNNTINSESVGDIDSTLFISLSLPYPNHDRYENNTLYGGLYIGMNLYDTSSLINNNWVNGTSDTGIAVEGDLNNITNNNVTKSGGGFTISGTNVIVTSNLATGNTGGGFGLDGCNATNNNATSNGGEGFDVGNSIATSDLANGNTRHGFIIDPSSTLNNDNATNNGGDGFYFDATSSDNLSNDFAHNNGGNGFDVNLSSDVVIANSTAYLNSRDGFIINDSSYSFFGGTSFNNLTNDSAYNNSMNGFDLAGTDNNLLNNDSAANDTVSGFVLQGGYQIICTPSCTTTYLSSTLNSLSGDNAFGNEYGFLLDNATFNNLTSSTAANNTMAGYGLSDSASSNILANDTTYNNTNYGFQLSSSQNNTLKNNTAFNTNTGFIIYMSSSNVLTNSLAYNNINDGFRLDSSNTNDSLNNNTAYNNSWGFTLYSNSNGNSLINDTSFKNTQYGYYLYSNSNSNIFTNDSAYTNPYGLFIYQSSNNTITNSTTFNNTNYGVYFSSSVNNSLLNSVVFNNTNGIGFAGSSDNNTIFNNTISNNTHIGVRILDSNGTSMQNEHFSNNNPDFEIIADPASPPINLHMTNEIFDNPSGNLSNFTNLSITDHLSGVSELGESYSINWTATPSSLPTSHQSFAGKNINISANVTGNDLGSVSIDSIIWSWKDSELTGFDKTKFQLWKYNASGWSMLNSSPNTVADTLSLSAMNPGSIYGILQNANCPVIGSSGTYILGNNLVGAPNSASEAYSFLNSPAYSCVRITASNVVFNCNGYNITNDGTGNATGILVIPSMNNVTIENCPGISQYYIGGMFYTTSNGNVINITAYNNSNTGFGMYYSNNSRVINNSFFNNTLGLMTWSDNNATCFSNNVSNNSLVGIANNYLNSNNSFFNNHIVNSQYGVQSEQSTNTTIFNNMFNNSDIYIQDNNDTIFSNTVLNLGIFANGGGNNTFFNNSVYNASDGFFSWTDNNDAFFNNSILNANHIGIRSFQESNDSFSNNTLINDSTGIDIESDSNLSFSNNSVSNNLEGVYTQTDANLAFSNNSIFNNNIGIVSESSNNSAFTNDRIYGNPQAGIYISSSNITRLTTEHFFNNSIDANIIGPSSNVILSNVTFDNPAGNYQNLTDFYLNDNSVLPSESYTIKWSAQPAAPIPGFTSFWGKFINITATSGSPSIDFTLWQWNTSEVSGWNESRLQLWKYNASGWVLMNNTPSLASHSMANVSLTPGGAYGILEQNDTTPPVMALNSPGTGSATNSTTVVFNFTATDDFSPSMNCSLYLDSALNMTNSSTINGTATTFTVPGLAIGSHSWFISCTDQAGNNANSSAKSFSIDQTPPLVSIQSPKNASYAQGTVPFNFTVTDNVAVGTCWYKLDGEHPISAARTRPSQAYRKEGTTSPCSPTTLPATSIRRRSFSASDAQSYQRQAPTQ